MVKDKLKPTRQIDARTQSSLGNRLLLLAISLVFSAAILLLLEGVVRLVFDVQVLGNSSHLFIAKAFGASKGNAKNVEAISFGTRVYTDSMGFRVASEAPDNLKRDATLLILGDSVAFGPGIEETQTFVGLLRRSLPQIRILNTSVIGYGAEDYKNFTDHFLTTNIAPNEVLLVYCLNDISSVSARLIHTALERRHDWDGLIEWLSQISIVEHLNTFLRTRSQLYLLVKNLLTDPQARHWRADANLYDIDNDRLKALLQPIIDVSQNLRRRNIPFSVVLVPYEYQLRMNTPDVWHPQQQVSTILTNQGVVVIDSAGMFRARNQPSRDFFLAGDPMHLSQEGHSVLHDVIMGQLRNSLNSGN